MGLRAYAELGVPMEASCRRSSVAASSSPDRRSTTERRLIQGNRITAAGCFLPLSRNLGLSRTLGTTSSRGGRSVRGDGRGGRRGLRGDGRDLSRGRRRGRARARPSLLGERLAALLGASEASRGRRRSLFAGVRRFTARSKAWMGSGPPRRELAPQARVARLRDRPLDVRGDRGGGRRRSSPCRSTSSTRPPACKGDLARRRDGSGPCRGRDASCAVSGRGLPGGGEPQERHAWPIRSQHRAGERVEPAGARVVRTPSECGASWKRGSAVGGSSGPTGSAGVANAPPLTPELTCRLGRIAAACLTEGCPSTRRHPPDRSGHPRFRPAPRAGAGGRRALGGRGRLGGRRPPDAGGRGPHARAGCRRRGRSCPRLARSRTGSIGSSRPRVTSCPTRGRTRPRRAFSPAGRPPSDGSRPGTAAPVPGAEGRYLDGLRSSLPGGFSLAGRRIVLDCAHGATYRVGPRLFRSLGAEVLTLGTRPNGVNINRGGARSIPRRSRRVSGRRPARSASRWTGTATV